MACRPTRLQAASHLPAASSAASCCCFSTATCRRPPPVVLSDDLVRNPEGTLRALCAALDIEFQPQASYMLGLLCAGVLQFHALCVALHLLPLEFDVHHCTSLA